MGQTTLSVALEVKPASQDRLARLLDKLRRRPSVTPTDGPGPYADVTAKVPALHFMSISVFPGFDNDPLFVVEVNFDGAEGPFWAQLEALIGEELRAMLRCCKRPLDDDGPLFEAVTRANSRAPIAPYLEARSLTPTVFHHGNRGLTRDRILAERALFLATRAELGNAGKAEPNPYRQQPPTAIHARLRQALVGRFPWLDEAPPARIPLAQNLGDWARLIGFALGLVFVLSLPGLLLKAVMPWPWFATICVVLLVGCVSILYRTGQALPGTAVPTLFTLRGFLLRRLLVPVVLAIAGYVLFAGAVAGVVCTALTSMDFATCFKAMAIRSGWSAGSVAVIAALLLVWLRWLERRDSSQDAPPVDPKMLRQMAQREDWIPQNHMGSLVLIKPGVLRAILIRVGHHGLHLLLRVLPLSRKGYLGSMRTIHFAHWARVNNDSRLMFFSNFDQTWESYLDDFIEKAHAGLTAAWSCGTGFPPTRFLLKDGASHGRQFKEWARHSMTVSRFWYSAYRDLTTEQIERNNCIADGLRKKTLSEKDAALWVNEL